MEQHPATVSLRRHHMLMHLLWFSNLEKEQYASTSPLLVQRVTLFITCWELNKALNDVPFKCTCQGEIQFGVTRKSTGFQWGSAKQADYILAKEMSICHICQTLISLSAACLFYKHSLPYSSTFLTSFSFSLSLSLSLSPTLSISGSSLVCQAYFTISQSFNQYIHGFMPMHIPTGGMNISLLWIYCGV